MENTNTPVVGGDTYSYKGWLNSDNFLKRVFAIMGYGIVGQLIIYLAIFTLVMVVGLVAVVLDSLI